MTRSNLFIVWFMVTCSDAISSLVAAILIRRRLRGSYARYLSWALFGIALEAVVAGTTLLVWWPTEAIDNPWFAVVRASGRSIKSAGIWMFALYLLGILNGNTVSTPTVDAIHTSGELSEATWMSNIAKVLRATIKDDYLK